MLRIGAEEGRYVGSGLGHDKMVHVEELSDARKGGVAVVIVGLAPGAEGYFVRRCPWNNGTSFILAF